MISHTIESKQSTCQLGGTCLLSKGSFLEEYEAKKSGAMEGATPD